MDDLTLNVLETRAKFLFILIDYMVTTWEQGQYNLVATIWMERCNK